MTPENTPAYLSRQQLASLSGQSLRTLTKHETLNVGNLQAAREVVSGIGIVYATARCRKYLALAATTARRRAGAAKKDPPSG